MCSISPEAYKGQNVGVKPQKPKESYSLHKEAVLVYLQSLTHYHFSFVQTASLQATTTRTVSALCPLGAWQMWDFTTCQVATH